MKKLFFAVFVLMLSFTAKAQEITELRETLITAPLPEKIITELRNFLSLYMKPITLNLLKIPSHL